MDHERPLCALTIAGSDSGGGAGIQADLKTFAAHGVHGLSALTALTAQNTRGVTAVHVPPTEFLRAQLDALFTDFDVGAVKLGMLASERVIEAVADALVHYAPRYVVLDPVMVATSGARLLEADAVRALRTRLLPLATIVTPNVPEAEVLLGHTLRDGAAADRAVDELLAMGARAVLLKGGHLPDSDTLVDRYAAAGERATFSHPRLPVEGHGTGCTLASAIAAGLCRAHPLRQACERAVAYVHGALRHGAPVGQGSATLLEHFYDPAWRNAGQPGNNRAMPPIDSGP